MERFILKFPPRWWQVINFLQRTRREFRPPDCRVMMKDGNGNTHIYHNTDLLRHNLFGQTVNSWLFHRGPALYGGHIQLPPTSRRNVWWKIPFEWNEIHLYTAWVDGGGLFEALIWTHSYKCTYFRLQNYRKDISSSLFLCFSASAGWTPWSALAKSVGLFFSALLPGSSQIENSYLSPQARLSALTVRLWFEFRLGFHVQPSGSSNCRHMWAKAERKIWKRYILAKLPSKHRETVANTPKEGKKRRVFAHLCQPHYGGISFIHVNTLELNLLRISIPLKPH